MWKVGLSPVSFEGEKISKTKHSSQEASVGAEKDGVVLDREFHNSELWGSCQIWPTSSKPKSKSAKILRSLERGSLRESVNRDNPNGVFEKTSQQAQRTSC